MKNYVICTTLEEESLNTLKNLRNDIELKNANIHIVTVIEKQIYNVGLIPHIYPAEEQYNAIVDGATTLLKSVATSLGIDDSKVVYKCFFEYDREKKVKEYLDEVKADLAVVATRGKHGLDGFFSSSFTDYLCKFAPCDVLVMRPRK